VVHIPILDVLPLTRGKDLHTCFDKYWIFRGRFFLINITNHIVPVARCTVAVRQRM
jgi:hypothetical protein